MFKQGLSFVLESEGGYSNNPLDSGGATNFGIRQSTYDHWRLEEKLPTQNVKLITQDEVSAIYKKNYWDANKCDALPSKLAIAVFDWAVNSGGYAAIHLQALVGIMQDGKIGPQTIQAVSNHSEDQLLEDYLVDREEYYRKLVVSRPKDKVFLKGWLNRVQKLREYLTTLTA